MYVHLVSVLIAIFLSVFSVEKGLLFAPDADYTYGLILPALSWTIMNFSCIGLMECGITLANPFGSEHEDFAVPTFLEQSMLNARNAMSGDVPRELQRDGSISRSVHGRYPSLPPITDNESPASSQGNGSSAGACDNAGPGVDSPPTGIARNDRRPSNQGSEPPGALKGKSGVGDAGMITCSRRSSTRRPSAAAPAAASTMTGFLRRSSKAR
jgi:hypothetical protein